LFQPNSPQRDAAHAANIAKLPELLPAVLTFCPSGADDQPAADRLQRPLIVSARKAR
jgi:hypothetical protein